MHTATFTSGLTSGLTPGLTSPRLADRATVPAAIRGGTAHLRPLRAGEAGPLQAVFEASSAASREARYLAPVVRLPGAMVTALTAVDGCHHVAWLATVDGRPAGLARYVRVAGAPGRAIAAAELAFEVVDAHQGRGLGAVLLDAITTVALARGVRRVQASVAAGNTRSRALLERVGLQLGGRGPVLEGEGTLTLMDPPRVERHAVLRLALHVPSQPSTTGPVAGGGWLPVAAH
jgi:GNAT superfamily N-acetyltransferase